MTKAELYYNLRLFRRRHNLLLSQYPVDAHTICALQGVQVETLRFKTPGLRGVAVLPDNLIILDAKLSSVRRNYFCAHELCHHLFHKNLNKGAFQCYDAPPQQDTFLEWQANEGAAELLVPHRIFLPTVKKYTGCYESDRDFRSFRKYLAGEFGVSTTTIEFRFDSLKYELQQYLSGTPMEEIDILSDSQQRYLGIQCQSFNTRYLRRLSSVSARYPGA